MAGSKISEIRLKQFLRVIDRLLGMGIEQTQMNEAMQSLLREGNSDWVLAEANNDYFEGIIRRLIDFIAKKGQLKLEIEGPQIEQDMDARPELEMVPRSGKAKRPNTTNEDTNSKKFNKQELTSGRSPEQLVNLPDLEKDDPHMESKGKRPVFDTAPQLEEPKIEPVQRASAQIKEPLMGMPAPLSPRAVSSAPGEGPVNLEDGEFILRNRQEGYGRTVLRD